MPTPPIRGRAAPVWAERGPGIGTSGWEHVKWTGAHRTHQGARGSAVRSSLRVLRLSDGGMDSEPLSAVRRDGLPGDRRPVAGRCRDPVRWSVGAPAWGPADALADGAAVDPARGRRD